MAFRRTSSSFFIRNVRMVRNVSEVKVNDRVTNKNWDLETILARGAKILQRMTVAMA